MTHLRLLLVVALLTCFGEAPHASAAISTAPRPAVPSIAAGGDSFAPQFSSDGKSLFFQSLANDLVPDDPSALTLDLFRYQPESQSLVRISAEPVIGGKPADWISPVVSADGDLVVFASLSTAIVPGKTNSRVMDIFWKRVSSGEMGLVSVSSNGISGGNADSREPVISADGRYVAFESDATDLAPVDAVSAPAGTARSVIYLRDLQQSQVTAVSAPSNGTAVSASGHAPSLSSDGRLLAFYTRSLAAGSTATRVVVRDNLSGETVWTYTMDQFTGNNCRGPQFSPDAKRVAYFSRETFARMRLAVHDLQTGEDFGLTNNFFLCAPITWSTNSQQIYFETFFQIGSWDLKTGDLVLKDLRGPTSVQSSASWSGLTPSIEGSFVIYRDTLPPSAASGNRRLPELFLRAWPEGPANPLTLDPTGAPAAHAEIGTPVLSADNRWVAFEASDSTLAEGDINRSRDIYLLDLQTGRAQLISTHRLRDGTTTGAGMLAGKVSLAGGNRFLAFSAGDGNYAVGDTNLSLDLFIQDITTGNTTNVTLRQPGFLEPYQRYLFPQLSQSGEVVAFLSFGVNGTDGSGFPFATELHVVNLSSGDHQTLMPPGNDLGLQGSLLTPDFHLSANGRRIAFQTHTSDFGADRQIMVRDLSTGSNTLVSATPSRSRGNRDSSQPWVTPDSKRVIFLSTSTDLLPQPVIPSTPGLRRLYERDLESGTNRLLSTNLLLYSVDAPVVSPDGRYAAFRLGKAPEGSFDALARVVDLSGALMTRTYPGVRQIYGFDQQSRYAVGLMTNASTLSSEGTLCRLDLTTGEKLTFSAGRGLGFWLSVTPDSPPAISADGRYIVFESPDDSLVSGDKNRRSDIFVRDLFQGTTLLVSSSVTGNGSGNGVSCRPTLSADGNAAVFRSRASDLSSGDFNHKEDLFVLTFDHPDTDSDGLPDDWEITYFGSLSRDGTGDFDSDGQTDAAEYQAGTDPTGVGSVFRVLTLHSSGGQETEILWASVVGKRYRVEYKDSTTQVKWITGISGYASTSTTARWTDPNPSPTGQRFYRVVVLE